jgi:hypothetical protein
VKFGPSFPLFLSLALSSCIKRDSPYAFEPSLTLVPVSLLFHPFSSLASYLSLITLYHSCGYKGFCMYLRASCSAPNVHCPLSFLCVCTVVLCLEITLLHSRLPPFSFSLATFIVRLSHTPPSSHKSVSPPCLCFRASLGGRSRQMAPRGSHRPKANVHVAAQPKRCMYWCSTCITFQQLLTN